jgi:hypothetical protein
LIEELESNTAEYAVILNKGMFRDMIGRHRQGKEDFSLQIFTLLVYLRWMRECYRGIGARRTRDGPGELRPARGVSVASGSA